MTQTQICTSWASFGQRMAHLQAMANLEPMASNPLEALAKPKSDGLQPTSDGLHPSSDGLHPKSDGLQPNSDGS